MEPAQHPAPSAKAAALLAPLALLLALLPAIAWADPVISTQEAAADHDAQTLYVGVTPLQGFFSFSPEGEVSGYGIDAVSQIASRAGLSVAYVYAANWEDLTPLLRAGTIDAMLPVSDTKRSISEFAYSSEAVAYTYRAVMTMASRDDLYYNDLSTLGSLRIAATDVFINDSVTRSYFEGFGASPTLVPYATYAECRAALEAGQVDALISNIMDYDDQMKVIERFNPSNNYLIMRADDSRMASVNNALVDTKLCNPDFFTNLQLTYFPERNQTPLTREETQLVTSAPAQKVGICTGSKPFCFYDEDDNLTGIAVEFVKLVAQASGLDLQPVAYTSADQLDQALANGDIDMAFPFTGTPAANMRASNSVATSTVEFATLEGSPIGISESTRIGVIASNCNAIRAIQADGFSNFTTFATPELAISALRDKDVDCLAASASVLGYLLQNPRYNDVRITSFTYLEAACRFTGPLDETMVSVLNKAIDTIPAADINQVITSYTTDMPYQTTLLDNLYASRWILLAALLVALALFAAVFLHLRGRTQLARQLAVKNEELEQANQAKTRFLSDMSHDMRTPMNAIIGLTALARDDLDDKNSVRRYLEDIGTSSRFLLGLVNDVLDMSKIENGSIELHPQDYRLASLGTVVQSLFATICEERSLTLQVQVPATLPDVRADQLRLEQIFLNLLSNATKYTPKGGTISFAIAAQPQQGGLIPCTFTVADSGVGMSAAFQRTAFDPFSQEHAMADESQGTGLGLYIVKRLVDQMGGTIALESAPDEGTTFTIKLALAPATGIPLAPAAAADQQPALPASLAGKRILLADDHPMNTTIAIKLLQKAGVQVTAVEDGQQALDAFAGSAPFGFDAVLMDVRMPVMDGLAATRAIRALDRPDAASTPIIALTANAYDEDIRATRDAGMNLHLAKPIDPQTLYAALDGFLTGK